VDIKEAVSHFSTGILNFLLRVIASSTVNPRFLLIRFDIAGWFVPRTSAISV